MVKKVAAVVQNSVLHDARVLKEAETLQRAGYAVKVFGIKDANNVFDEKILPSGVAVRLVGWRSAFHRAIQKVTLLLLFVLLPLLGMAVWFGSALVLNLLPGHWSLDLAWLTKAVLRGSTVGVVVLGGAYYLYRFYRRQRRFAQNYESIEAGAGATAVKKNLAGQLVDNFLFVRQRALAAACLEWKPQVVHCHDVHTIKIGVDLKRRLGVKVVYDAHEIYEEVAQGSSDQKRANRRLQKVAEKTADGFITINRSIADYYSHEYPGLPPATIVMNACRFEPELPAYDGRLHKAAGLPAEQRILLYQGGFAQRRGLLDLVRVAAFLPKEWTLVFMGWGNIKDALVAEAKEINSAAVRKRVRAQIEEHELGFYQRLRDRKLEEVRAETSELEEVERVVSDLESELRALEGRVAALEARLAASEFPEQRPVSPDHVLVAERIKDLERTLIEIDRRTIAPRIAFVERAPQSELQKWTMGGDIGVIPYEYVGLNHYFCTPNKLWEYPAAGLPMLISPFPEMRAIVEGNDLGWLLDDPIEPRQMAEQILALSDDELESKRRNCREFIAGNNWSNYEAALLELYGTLDSAR